MRNILYEEWNSLALSCLDRSGLLKRYRGSFEIRNIDGVIYLCIKDERDELGLYDLMMAWREGVEVGLAKARIMAVGR
jgi:hypothetical protein